MLYSWKACLFLLNCCHKENAFVGWAAELSVWVVAMAVDSYFAVIYYMIEECLKTFDLLTCYLSINQRSTGCNEKDLGGQG